MTNAFENLNVSNNEHHQTEEDSGSPEDHMVTLTKEQFLSVLEDIKTSVMNNDTMEGCLNYSAMHMDLKPGEFKVVGAYRIGNSQGQGGTRIISK